MAERKFRYILGRLWLAGWFLVNPAMGLAGNFSPEQIAFFESKVRPVLAEQCYGCHGPKKQNNGLRLDSRAAILKGGYGPAVVPGKPDESKLIRAIRHDQTGGAEPMPKDQPKLTPEAIEALTEWVRQGLPWPEEAASAGVVDPRNHWAFQPVKMPTVPSVTDPKLVYQPMDAFVIAGLAKTGLLLSEKADRATRIRRLQMDLLGFPPTYAEVQAFVSDTSPDAYIRLVDRLLASPHYGERMARHWLDVARYADTKGYVFQEERRYPYAYTYRDWVIRAYNADLPYDDFLRFQIAADRIEGPQQAENLAAMGFLTLGRRFLNNQPDIIDDRLDVVFRGTQAMTIGCARCHDHKVDPIPTADYYGLYGVFASSTEPKELPELKTQENSPEAADFEKGMAERQQKLDAHRQQKLDNIFAAEVISRCLTVARDAGDKKGDELRRLARDRDVYLPVLQRWQKMTAGNASIFGPWQAVKNVPDAEFAAKLSSTLAAAEAGGTVLPAVIKALRTTNPPNRVELDKAYGTLLASASPKAAATPPELAPVKEMFQSANGLTTLTTADILPFLNRADKERERDLISQIEKFKATHRGSPPRAMVLQDKERPEEPVVFIRGNAGRRGPAVPRQFLEILSPGERKPFTNGSGRLELANAIANRENPLTARVYVNRLWAKFFGVPLVDSTSDFGVRTQPASNPELLDYLAARFMEQGWSVKKLIREILLSATYQQKSELRPDAAAKDPENRLTWRMNRKRLDFEAMRDTLLVVSGDADLTLFGRPVEMFDDKSSNRRSIYGFIDRQNLPGLLRTFDFASPDTHSPRRFETSVPQQALFMLNSPFLQAQAEKLLATVRREYPSDPLAGMFRRVFSRDATPEEIRMAADYLGDTKGPPRSQGPWSYGYGFWNSEQKQTHFTPFTAFKENTGWCASGSFPDQEVGYASLGAAGGHPGNNDRQSAIRRWTADFTGSIDIKSEIKSTSPPSKGIKGIIVSSRHGKLGEWTVGGGQTVVARCVPFEIKAGDTLDFIMDCAGDPTHDSFVWNPEIREAPTKRSLTTGLKGFTAPKSPPWEALAQALLCANELVFVD